MMNYSIEIVAALVALFFFVRSRLAKKEKDAADKAAQDSAYRESLQQAFQGLQLGLQQIEEKKRQMAAQVQNASPQELEKLYESLSQTSNTNTNNSTGSDNGDGTSGGR